MLSFAMVASPSDQCRFRLGVGWCGSAGAGQAVVSLVSLLVLSASAEARGLGSGLLGLHGRLDEVGRRRARRRR